MSTRTPSYRLHKPSGQAVVTLDGQDHYLGKHGTEARKGEYDRLIAGWLANGRRLAPAADATISEFMGRYVAHVDSYYRKGGRPTSEATLIEHQPARRHPG